VTWLILTHLDAQLARARSTARPRRDTGAITTEYIVVVAVIVALAVAVLAVLSTKLMAKVNTIDLG
jgi:heme/copper-type cytochrome/quinol oxidase subunit 2